MYFAGCRLDYICLFPHFSSKRKPQEHRQWDCGNHSHACPSQAPVCLDGISLVLTFPMKNMHHHTVDAVVHLTLSLSIAYIYMHIYARHEAKAANPSYPAHCLMLTLTPGKHRLKQCRILSSGLARLHTTLACWDVGYSDPHRKPCSKRGAEPFSPINPDVHLNKTQSQ